MLEKIEEKKEIKTTFKIITIIVTILLILFVIYGLKLGILEDKNLLVNYMKRFGVFAPLFFVFLQIIQVVFPVVPGGASCLAGVLAFGPFLGFIYNYIGLTIGSIVAFSLSRQYGIQLVEKFFQKETIEKYLNYIKTNKFNKIFFLGILLPGLPDDLLCYIAGLSKMNLRKFTSIILIGKPLALLMYSFFIELF